MRGGSPPSLPGLTRTAPPPPPPLPGWPFRAAADPDSTFSSAELLDELTGPCVDAPAPRSKQQEDDARALRRMGMEYKHLHDKLMRDSFQARNGGNHAHAAELVQSVRLCASPLPSLPPLCQE